MQNIETFKYRLLLFLFGCIGSRLALTVLSARASSNLLALLGWLSLIPVAGWIYIIFVGKRDTGPEVFGDKIWWKSLRPVHAALWLAFAVVAIQQKSFAWRILLADTLFGLAAFTAFHWYQGNIQSLFS